MRTFIAILLACIFNADARAAPAKDFDFQSADAVLAWINGYRQKPEPDRLPSAVRALSRFGVLRDPDSSGVYIGFASGVIGTNPDRADALVDEMFPLPPEDHWVIVRAIAYSGLPDWKALLTRAAPRLPTRAAMIAKYLDNTLPTPAALAPVKKPGVTDRLRDYLSREKKDETAVTWALDASPELLDTMWGRYFATASYGPILRIVGMLPWSKDKDNVERLTLGSMAKYTLASNSARDAALLTTLKRAARHQSKDTAAILKEITDAADTMQITAIRKQALLALDDLKRKGPGYQRDAMTWGRIGEGAISLGCIGAAVAGQVALGLPCVVGGAVTSAALKGLAAQ